MKETSMHCGMMKSRIFIRQHSNEHCLEGDRLLREGKYKEAVQSYLHGAYKEDPESLCSLGMCYEFELGVIENFDKAVHYYMAASRLGYLPAKNMLRCLLTDGECWFQKDLELGIGVRLDLLLMVDVKRLERDFIRRDLEAKTGTGELLLV